MKEQTLSTIQAAERAVTRLVKKCQKQGPLYVQCPKAVAQVSRTGKWLLSAIAALRRELNTARAEEEHHA